MILGSQSFSALARETADEAYASNGAVLSEKQIPVKEEVQVTPVDEGAESVNATEESGSQKAEVKGKAGAGAEVEAGAGTEAEGVEAEMPDGIGATRDITAADEGAEAGEASATTENSTDTVFEETDQLPEADEESAMETADALPGNPEILQDPSMTESGQKVTWDCVWFGSYPQREVVGNAGDCGIYGRVYASENDYIVDAGLYSTLQQASWNSSGDALVGGVKYRRLKKEDATWSEDDDCFTWSTGADYHYFKYEPIKWRVLHVSDGKALLLADQALDDQKYNEDDISVTWENCTMRSWLNDTFFSCAFSEAQQNAILSSTLENKDNLYWGIEGGNNTTDKVFLLSEEDVYVEGREGKNFASQTAMAYGFASSYSAYDKARRCKSSTFAKAMGVYSEDYSGYEEYWGNCWWWLRSPGDDASDAADVGRNGDVRDDGSDVSSSDDAARPALNLNLSSSSWSSAGTVSSDGLPNEIAPPEPTPAPEPQAQVRISSISIAGISSKIAAGKKVRLTANITPANAANKAVNWTSGNTKVATVDANGLVTVKAKTGGGSVVITATAKDGSGRSASFKITSMKGAVKSVKLSGSKTVKAGKSLKLKATVKTSKGKANKKLKWTSANTNLAIVTSSGKVKTFKGKKGKVKITAMATDGTNKKKSVTIKIK